MTLSSFLLDLLVDPLDHGALLYVPSKELLFNPRSGVVYEVRDSIPVLLPGEARRVSDQEAREFNDDPHARLTGTREGA